MEPHSICAFDQKSLNSGSSTVSKLRLPMLTALLLPVLTEKPARDNGESVESYSLPEMDTPQQRASQPAFFITFYSKNSPGNMHKVLYHVTLVLC